MKWKVHADAVEPLADFRVLVGGVIVENRVNNLAGRNPLRGVEKADELLMPMALHVRPMTVPSRTSRAANSVVVPCRL